MSWLGQAATIQSKGSISKKAKRLSELHARRKATGAQYFTGEWVGAGIWSVLKPLLDSLPAERCLSVVDTSIGSGRLLQHADIDRCLLYGLDVDERCIQALSEDAEAAGAFYTFEAGSLEDLTMSGFDIAVLNPPFSLNLQSPLMSPYGCTAFGRFGPNTSALSHEYALAQALEGASVVAALLPVGMEETCRQDKRLKGIYRLPNDAFKDENACVSTAVFLFDAEPTDGEVLDVRVEPGDAWPRVSLVSHGSQRPTFRIGGIDRSSPTITLPVTGDRRVRLEHHNRRMVLKFACGLTQAKVMNGILVDDVIPVEQHRYPKGVRYVGDARLWMDTWLLQKDPKEAFDAILAEIRLHGGEPVVAPTLAGYWRKLVRRHKRAMTPFRHWVKKAGDGGLRVEATRSSLLRDGDLRSPVIRKGEQLCVEPLGGEYRVTKDDESAVLSRSVFEQRFKRLEEDERKGATWTLVEEGLVSAFPAMAHEIEQRLKQSGIDWLWPFQKDGAIEHLIKPYGGVAAWKQGLGKARLAIALALMSGKHSLIVVESCLVDEMLIELRDKLELDASLWRIIERHDDPMSIDLSQVNVISYNTLKRRVRGRRTVAKLLRRRFHTVIADEGGILSNPTSQQSRALMALAPKKLIVSDGTPIPNYPKDLHPVVAACSGDAVAHQPYGLRHAPFVEPRLFQSASYAMRGVDAFREKHMVLEWCTNQFKDDNRSAAKREVPKIAKVVEFREWVQPNVQRKVRYEPEVEPYAGCPKPIYRTIDVPWDRGHLRHYLDVALNFAQWYLNHLQARMEKGQGANLIAVLARIGAVLAAANNPAQPRKNSLGVYLPLTSKQRLALERIEKYVSAGKKIILYAYAPATVERLAKALNERGIKSVLFHGGIPIEKRTKALNEDFRFGDTDVLLSTWCGQKGLNIPQGKVVIKYERNWTGRTEDQAVHRTQRPDQTDRVIVEALHIKGSIDEYVAQLVSWKEAAADSGLDWGDGVADTDVFKHLDSIIEEFCRDTLEMSASDAFKALAA